MKMASFLCTASGQVLTQHTSTSTSSSSSSSSLISHQLMKMELHTPTTNNGEPIFEDFDSNCSTPYVSAPSSPGRGPLPSFFYSAPASPMHFAITTSTYEPTPSSAPMAHDFDFSARFGPIGPASMTSADELFLNGQIRPMKLSTHLQRPQVLAPLLDLDDEEEEDDDDDDNNDNDAVNVNVNVSVIRGRDLRLRDKSLRRRTRSMSPLRTTTPLEWSENDDSHTIHAHDNVNLEKQINTNGNGNGNDSSEAEKVEDGSVSGSGSSSRSSSAGRSSKRWVFLKDFLRSKSEGRSNNKFWSTISFSPTKDKKSTLNGPLSKDNKPQKPKGTTTTTTSQGWARRMSGKPTNGVGKRRVPPSPSPSPHELHYKANRAQAQELRKKTFLPYRQGLLGCLGFSSKGYGAMNGFARALNPVSSR